MTARGVGYDFPLQEPAPVISVMFVALMVAEVGLELERRIL